MTEKTKESHKDRLKEEMRQTGKQIYWLTHEHTQTRGVKDRDSNREKMVIDDSFPAHSASIRRG